VEGHLVVTGDDEDRVVARVIGIIDRPGGLKVVMELVGDAGELVEPWSGRDSLPPEE
jgi:hypothetical protein